MVVEENLYRGCVAEARGERWEGLRVLVAAATNIAVDESLAAFLKSFGISVTARIERLKKGRGTNVHFLRKILEGYEEQTRNYGIH